MGLNGLNLFKYRNFRCSEGKVAQKWCHGPLLLLLVFRGFFIIIKNVVWKFISGPYFGDYYQSFHAISGGKMITREPQSVPGSDISSKVQIKFYCLEFFKVKTFPLFSWCHTHNSTACLQDPRQQKCKCVCF